MVFYTHEWAGSFIREHSERGADSIFEFFRDDIRRSDIVELKTDAGACVQNNDEIKFKSHYLQALSKAEDLISEMQPDKILHIGGGCALEVPVIKYLKSKYPGLQVIWFDAHADLHTPATSKSKYIHGMASGLLVRDNPILKSKTLHSGEIHFSHLKDADTSELEFIRAENISHSSSFLELMEYVDAMAHGTPVYVHIDFDVFDPEEVLNMKSKKNSGIKISEIEEAIQALSSHCNLTGVSLLENVDCGNSKLNKFYGFISSLI